MSRPTNNPNNLKTETGKYSLKVLEVSKDRVVLEEHDKKNNKVTKHIFDTEMFKPSHLETLSYIFGLIHDVKSQRPNSTGLFTLTFITCRGLKDNLQDNLKEILKYGYRYELTSSLAFSLKVAPEDHRVWSDIPFNV